jgi:hypothetical protein
VPYFEDRIQFISEEIVNEVFQEINNRQPEFVNVI